MKLIRNLIFLLIFFAAIGLVIFFSGVILIVGLLLLPLALLGTTKIKKTEIHEKTIDVDFKRVE